MGYRKAIPVEIDYREDKFTIYLFPDGSRMRDDTYRCVVEKEYITPDGESAWYNINHYCSGTFNKSFDYCYGCGKLFYFEDARYRCCSDKCRKDSQLRHGRESIAIHNIARSNRLQQAREGMKCLHCGNSMYTETNRKRYCNAGCKQAAYRQRQLTS